jgi:hypothetical protein
LCCSIRPGICVRFVSYFLCSRAEQWLASVVDCLFYSVASCLCLTPIQWLSLGFILLLLLFSTVPMLCAGFLAQICWSGFIFLTFSLRSSLAGALFSCCCFLLPACAGHTSIERPNLCQAFGPVSSLAGHVMVVVPTLNRSRDSEILVPSRFRSLIHRCCYPRDEF